MRDGARAGHGLVTEVEAIELAACGGPERILILELEDRRLHLGWRSTWSVAGERRGRSAKPAGPSWS
jgi:hypothetical protein